MWEQAFWDRRRASHDAAVDDGMSERQWIEAEIAESRRALRREVAAVRRLDLPDGERRDRLGFVSEQIKTEIADSLNELKSRVP